MKPEILLHAATALSFVLAGWALLALAVFERGKQRPPRRYATLAIGAAAAFVCGLVVLLRSPV